MSWGHLLRTSLEILKCYSLQTMKSIIIIQFLFLYSVFCLFLFCCVFNHLESLGFANDKESEHENGKLFKYFQPMK